MSGAGRDVVHAHNMLPLIGPRGLEAARDAGREGGPPPAQRAPVLRHRLRRARRRPVRALPRTEHPSPVCGSTAAARCPRPRSTPRRSRCTSRTCWRRSTASSPRARSPPTGWRCCGLPRDRVHALAHYLPDEAFAERSRAGEGAYALVTSRLSPEKGIDVAIAAAAGGGGAAADRGRGPGPGRLEELAAAPAATSSSSGAWRPQEVRELLAGAAAVLMPSRYHEFSPYSALEAMAQGVPVVATAMGGLPELLGAGGASPLGDVEPSTPALPRSGPTRVSASARGRSCCARSRAARRGALRERAAGALRVALGREEAARQSGAQTLAPPRERVAHGVASGIRGSQPVAAAKRSCEPRISARRWRAAARGPPRGARAPPPRRSASISSATARDRPLQTL